MARTPVNWNPNRYGSVKHVLKFDAATGTYSLQEQEQNYNNTYNFTSLPSDNTQTQTSTNTNTQSQSTTSAQTTEAFGDVMPLYAQKDDNDPFSAEFSKGTMTDANTVGFNIDNNKNSFYDNLSDAEKNAIATGTSGITFRGVGDATKQYVSAKDYPGTIGQIGGDDMREQYRIGNIAQSDPAYTDKIVRMEGPYSMSTAKTYRTPRTIADQNKYLGRTFTEKPTGLLSNVKSKLGDVKSRMIDPAIESTKKTFLPPTLALIKAIAGEETSTNKHDKAYFTAYTSGSMAGRITGDDGKYDPSNNLYHGMNKVSMYGNLEKAGQKRIDRINKTIAKKKAKGEDTTTLEARVKKFEDQQNEYSSSKNDHNIASYNKNKAKTQGSITQLNPHEMRNVAETGDAGGDKGGKSIICTQMYQQTKLEDWKKTMRLWYIFQKKYLTMEHQEGYHFLFKPFVNGMKKSKVLTALGKHCAIARTNDIKHIMFGTPFSLSGRLVRLVTEPICYITGKIKSWL